MLACRPLGAPHLPRAAHLPVAASTAVTQAAPHVAAAAAASAGLPPQARQATARPMARWAKRHTARGLDMPPSWRLGSATSPLSIRNSAMRSRSRTGSFTTPTLCLRTRTKRSVGIVTAPAMSRRREFLCPRRQLTALEWQMMTIHAARHRPAAAVCSCAACGLVLCPPDPLAALVRPLVLVSRRMGFGVSGNRRVASVGSQ
jgi:hypothetical protein